MIETKPITRQILLSINRKQLRSFDRVWRKLGYKSRSHAIREVIAAWTRKQGVIEPTIKELEARIVRLEKETL